MIEQREYEAFRAFPAVAGTVSPIRPVDVTTGHARVTLQGTGFSVRIQISNAQPGRGDQPHLFVPPDASFETFKTVTPDDPPTMIPAPVRWLRLIVDAGVITGGNVAESSRTGAEINERLLAGIVQKTTLMEQAAGVGRVATEADLTGKPGTPEKPIAYELTSTNERLLWDGQAIVPGSRGPMLVDVNAQKRIAVDATLYGVQDGADVQTLMAAIAGTPDGAELIVPAGIKLMHNGGRLMIVDRNINVRGNGLTVEAKSDLVDNEQNGGFYFVNCRGTWSDIAYDGRLDTRVPFGGDAANTNQKSGFNVLYNSDMVFERVYGNRCMMDGVYLGHHDDTYPGLPAPTQATMPRLHVVGEVGGSGNYRQGVSVVGCNSLTGDYLIGHNTGKTAGKGTLPMAGVDLEAYVEAGFYNLGVDLKGIKANGNAGHAVLLEQGTQGAIIGSVRGSGNGGGVGAVSLASDNTVYDVNLTNSGIEPSEPVNIVLDGSNNRIIGLTLTCEDGSQAVVIKPTATTGTGVYGALITCKPGSQRTGSVGNDGAGVLDDITVIGGRQTIAGYGVVDVRGAGAVTRNVTATTTGDTTSRPLHIAGGIASNLRHTGYTKAPVLTVPGTRLTVPAVSVEYSQGRAMSQYAPAGLGKIVSVLRDEPDLLIMRVQWTGVWDAGAAGAGRFFIANDAGYAQTIRYVQGYYANDGRVGQIVLLDGNNVDALIPANTFFPMTYTADVEMRRA